MSKQKPTESDPLESRMTHRYRITRATVCTMMCALPMYACGPAAVEPNEEYSEAQQELYTGFGNFESGADYDDRFTFPWDSPGIVSVCYLSPGGSNTPDPTRMALSHDAITTSWGTATGLNFVNKGKCPTPIPSAWISVFLQTSGNGGEGYGGVGSRMPPLINVENRTDIQVRVGNRPGSNKRLVAHELGHALGFHHEMYRAEAAGSDCDESGAGEIHGLLTSYDRDSIMIFGYCPSVRSEISLLSTLDKLGAEMMYPKARTGYRLACKERCVWTGTGAIVREDGSVTIDWVARGADVISTWTVPGGQVTDRFLHASHLANGTSTVFVAFPDAFSNPQFRLFIPTSQAHPGLFGGGTVVKSNSVYTAVILTAG